ncbi:hypothetical protein C8R46DRAFT_1357007 [Mycena filopes]|nr:hypothetical protein C8R46DRAFT_1357007 [Mycena filopes]
MSRRRKTRNAKIASNPSSNNAGPVPSLPGTSSNADAFGEEFAGLTEVTVQQIMDEVALTSAMTRAQVEERLESLKQTEPELFNALSRPADDAGDDVSYIRVPGTNLCIRFYPGAALTSGNRWYCMDLYDRAAQCATVIPRHYWFFKKQGDYLRSSAAIYPGRADVRMRTIENILRDSSGTAEKFIVEENNLCYLMRPAPHSTLHFVVPIRQPPSYVARATAMP